MAKKITKTYSYESDVIKHAEQNPLINSFSKWACEKYREEYMNVEKLAIELDKVVKRSQYLREQIKKIKEDKENIELKFNQIELNWIKTEGIRSIHVATFEGVYKRFTRTFGNQTINRREFRLILEKYDPNGAKIGYK